MKKLIILIALLLAVGWVAFGQGSPKREFRASWIATVKNIDWPTRQGLTTNQQKEEYRQLLNHQVMMGMNAVIVQVRPSADAFYDSEIEPMSRYLTGVSDSVPYPYYDPLTFMIDEAHDRGLEFHAWFNPYRAVVDFKEMPEDSTNIIYTRPEWFVTYGTRMYFDPGIPEVKAYVTRVIKDVTERYDIDAIHFDDYFYPYRIAEVEFPDSLSFEKYGRDYDANTKDDWRRENVNSVIKMLSDTIKHVKPWVKFGISPFGVWRNKSVDPRGSDSRAGQTNYDDLFADVLLWMEKGWIDYVLPQLYLHLDHPLLSYRKVIKWWDEQEFNGHTYVGHAAYRIGDAKRDSAWVDPSQVPEQIRISRKLKNIHGSAYFSARPLMKNKMGFVDSLRISLYRSKALMPTMDWLDGEAPSSPSELKVDVEHGGVFLSWKGSDASAKYYVVYRFDGKEVDYNDPKNILAIQRANTAYFKDGTVRRKKKYTYAVTALDRLQNESEGSNQVYLKVKR